MDEVPYFPSFELPSFAPQHPHLARQLPRPPLPSPLVDNLFSSQPPMQIPSPLEAQLRASTDIPSKLLKIRQAGAVFLNVQQQRLQNLQIVAQFLREIEEKELSIQATEAKIQRQLSPLLQDNISQEGQQSTELEIAKEEEERSSPSGDELKFEGGVVKCPKRDCGAHFASQTSVKKHLKRHLRPFPCPYANCLKRFPESSTLKRHIRTHTGEKPFVCQFPECDKAFADRSNWRRHQHLHEEDSSRPKSAEYMCPYALCKRSFSRLPNLRRHMKSLSHYTSDSIKKEGSGDFKLQTPEVDKLVKV